MAAKKQRPKVLHVFRFKERYELDGYERKNGLEFTREFTNSGGTKSNEATSYHLQLDELAALAGDYYQALGVFIALRTMAACYERIYRGYLLDQDMEPLTDKKLALRLHLPTRALRSTLKLLIEVKLIERVDCPDFAALEAAEAENAEPLEDSKTVSNPLEKGKGKGTGKRTATASGKPKEKTNGNGKTKPKPKGTEADKVPKGTAESPGQQPSQEQAPGPAPGEGVTPHSPTPTPPSLSTSVDPGGSQRAIAHRAPRGPFADQPTPMPTPPPTPGVPTSADPGPPGGPPGSPGVTRPDMGADLARIGQVLKGGQPPGHTGHGQGYSNAAKEFAYAIYQGLGLAYSRTLMARELGTLASCWTRAELAVLSPSVSALLWTEAIRQAEKLSKKRKLRRPGAMFCKVFDSLLGKAAAGRW